VRKAGAPGGPERGRLQRRTSGGGRLLLTPLLLLAVAAEATVGAQSPGAGGGQVAGECPSLEGSNGLPALYCLDLVATPRARGAGGRVELGAVPSPFGVTVTPEGVHAYELRATIEGLPDPAALGPYTAYVAWATPLVLDPVVKLGRVENGENGLGRVAFNKFMVLVSAEASAEVEERKGPLVLRGRSPSTAMVPHDLLAQAPAAEQRSLRPEGEGPGASREAWIMPPAYPGVSMLPGMGRLAPDVSPLRAEVDPEGLPPVRPHRTVELPDGGALDLTAGYVHREIEGRKHAMLAFNGQHPGPLIKVRQASTIFVNLTNETPFPTTIHWHGLRLDNRFDGVPGLTQEAVEPGETFRYRVRFPDAGIYWYHPHHREDVQQELGLYGNMLVEPLAPDYYGPANRDEVLILDDLLLGEEGIVAFGTEAANFSLMGRFGNLFLVNGEPDYTLEVDRGEVVRFHFTNAASTRTFNLSIVPEGDGSGEAEERGSDEPDAGEPIPLKVVASDVSRFEREEWSRNVVLAPAERYVVEARFADSGRYRLVNHVQGINHRRGVYLPERTVLGTVRVGEDEASRSHAHAFSTLRTHDAVVEEIDRYRERFEDPPDHELVLSMEAEDLPEPVEQSMLYERVFFNPVEWTGTMPMMNWASTGREVRWILRDGGTGRENMAIDWGFRVGEVVKIRLRNERNVFHGMQHPIHIHGQRFLVLSRNGMTNENLAWKDTVLLPAGATVDILLELTNPGRWMVHCHIAEHLESGMRFVFDVEEEG